MTRPPFDLDAALDRWMTPNPLAQYALEHADDQTLASIRLGRAKGREMAKAAFRSGDWVGFTMHLTKAYRMEALLAVRHLMDGPTYWERVREVWTGVDNLWEYRDELPELLTDPRPGREALMTQEERSVLAALPEVVTLYRGCGRGLNERGWSWTLDEGAAHFFARYSKRWEGRSLNTPIESPVVLEGTAPRRQIVAFFSGSQESEIVVDPSWVDVRRLLPADRERAQRYAAARSTKATES